MDKLLEVKDLTVIYQTRKETVRAVNGISFSLDRRETLGFVGETGAGKTTTALSIMRLLPERTARIPSGEILFDGTSLLDLSETQMKAIRGGRISMIFQDPMTSLNPVLTIDKQIREALILHGDENQRSEEIDRRVEELLTLVGIEPSRKNSYPHELSGGMKQRVVIAMALACSPEVLIADEPTTALDVTIQAQVMEMMEELKSKLDMSIILITHDLGLIARICDNVAVMYSGEIIEYGSFEDLFVSDVHHPYTAGLFASIPNIRDEKPRLHPIPGLMPDPANLPSGCRFHPRCPRCMEICRSSSPGVYTDGRHQIRCHLFTGEVSAHE